MPLESVYPSRGVNLLADPATLADGQCAWAKNLYPHQRAILGKRYGAGEYIQLNTHTGENYPLTVAISPFNIGAYSFFIFLRYFDGSSCEIQFADDAGNIGTVTTAATNPAQRPTFVPFGSSLYLFMGAPLDPAIGTGYVLSSADGITVTAAPFVFQGTNNVFPVGAVGTYRNRVVYGNLGPGFEKNIVFSDPFLPDTIGNDVLFANGRSFTVGAPDGDHVIALVEVLQSGGTPAESALLVLCSNSAYLITGEPNLTTDSTDMFGSMAVASMPAQCGCASAATVVKTPYGLIWASAEDVWMFKAGQLPYKIGTNISPAFKNTPPMMRWRWHAAYFNKSYRLAVDTAGSSPGESDTCDDQWWLDLRQGAPNSPDEAMWWGPQQYLFGFYDDTGIDTGTLAMLSETRVGRPENLFLASFKVDVGGSLAVADIAKADDTVRYGGGTAPSVNSYFTSELWSRIEDAGDAALRKLYQGAEIGVWSSNPTGLQVEAQMDDGKIVNLATICAPGTGLQLDLGKLDTDLLDREYLALAARPSSPETQRIIGRRMQLRIREGRGLVVDYTNLKFVFSAPGYASSSPNKDGIFTAKFGVPAQPECPLGLFALQEDLLAAIADAMNYAVTAGVDEPFAPFTAIPLATDDSIKDVTNGLTWRPIWVPITGTDPLDVAIGVALGKLAGFDTSANPSLAVTQTAAVVIPNPPTAMLEFSELAMKFQPLPRRVL